MDNPRKFLCRRRRPSRAIVRRNRKRSVPSHSRTTKVGWKSVTEKTRDPTAVHTKVQTTTLCYFFLSYLFFSFHLYV